MRKKFLNKYRIESARLQNWDYAWNAAYFVTINTRDRQHYFGKILNHEMQLSEIGNLAKRFWNEIPVHFPFVILDEFVIMPDHIHGIIIINKHVETRHCLVSTNKNHKTPGQKRYQNQGKNTLSSIIGSYKSVVTKHARKLYSEFSWQPRFHDHIIRNSNALNNIRKYITNNPRAWKHQ